MEKHKKIYYVPGLLSLIGLPILCCLYLSKYMKQERVLEVTFASKYDTNINKKYLAYDTSVLSKPGIKRKYIDIELNGKKYDDEIKINYFRILTRDIIQKRDTINGVHMTLVDSAKYGSFVKVINNFHIDSLPTYCLFENNIWALYIKGTEIKYRERMKRDQAENMSNKHSEYMTKQLTFYDMFVDIKFLWPVLLSYLLLIIFTFKRLKL